MEEPNTKVTTSQNFQIQEKRKRIGSAVDKRSISQKSSTSEHLDNLNKEVQTDDRVFLKTKKGKICLGILLGILLCGIIAGIIIWYLLNRQCEKEKSQMSKEHQIITIDKCRKEMENWLAFESIKCVADVCYFFEEDKATWNEAGARCKNDGKFLAEIKTSAQSDLLFKFYSEQNVQQDGFWLGGKEEKGDKDKWVWQKSGETINMRGQGGYQNWSIGEPNNDFNENCLHIYFRKGTNGWNDWKCDNKIPYVCQSSKKDATDFA